LNITLALQPKAHFSGVSVQLCWKTNGPRGIGRILIVSLMLVLWLGTTALAASPQLHHLLHKDSKSAAHECLVTLLSKSQLLAGGEVTVVVALLPFFFGLLLIAESSRFSISEYRLSPSRAPPALGLSSNGC
jgi:hypothetical protein